MDQSSENIMDDLLLQRNMNFEKKKLPQLNEMKKKTLGESYRFLNLIVKGKSYEDFENILEILVQNQPSNKFEETLKLIVIDQLHLKDEVIKIFLSQNDWHIKRVLRCEWFFRNATSGDEFISKIFPHLSFSLRSKIVNKLSKHLESEVEAEKIVEFLYEQFSCELAETLLPKCSRAYISQYSTKARPKFQYGTSCRVLLNLSKRYPEIVGNILLEIFDSKTHSYFKFKKVILYLAAYNPIIFISLYKKYPSKLFFCKLGRKLSRCIGLKIKDSLFEFKNLLQIFNTKHLFLSFGEEDQIKFLVAIVTNKSAKLSYDSWDICEPTMAFLLKLISPKKRLFIISTVFKQVFDSDFKEHPKLWTDTILKLFPTEDRLFFVEKLEKLLEEGENDLKFLLKEPEELYYLYEFKTGFKKLKKILSKAFEIYQRQYILKHMIHNCWINKDSAGLEELVDFVEKKYRHDDINLIHDFIELILKLYPESCLSLSILEKLESLAYFCALKGNSKCYGLVAEKLMLCRLDRNMKIDSLLKNCFKFSILKLKQNYFIQNFRSNHSKMLILSYAKELRGWIEINSTETKTDMFLTKFLNTCKQFNKLNKKNPILVEELLDMEQALLKFLKNKYKEIEGENWFLDIWQRLYSRLLYSYSGVQLLLYALKKYSDIVAKSPNNVVKSILNFNSSRHFDLVIFFKRTVSFLNLNETVNEIILKEFRNGKRQALILYSHLVDVDDFRNAVINFLPKNERIDEKADVDFSLTQLLIPGLIKNLIPRWKNLNLILEFFFGDFLKAVMPSLYSCCYHTKTDDALSFLKKQLSQVPDRISYKKDFIRLIIDLSPRKERINFSLISWEKNKHCSIRTILFMEVSKTFLEKPNQEGFEVLKKFVFESDETLINSRPSLDSMPGEFLFEYVSTLWDFSEGQSQWLKDEIQNSIISFFNKKNMKVLPKYFCEKIIKDNLFKFKTLYEIQNFAIYYLMLDPEEIPVRMSWMLKLFKDASSTPSNFLNILCHFSLKYEGSYVYVFNTLLNECVISFEERLSLTYYYLYHQITERNNSKVKSFFLGEEIGKFCLNLNNLSDLLVLLIDSLSDFFENLKISKKPFDELLAIKGLIKVNQNRSIAILGISLLPDDSQYLFSTDETFGPTEMKRKKELNEIIQFLQNYNDEVVNIYLNRKLSPSKNDVVFTYASSMS